MYRDPSTSVDRPLGFLLAALVLSTSALATRAEDKTEPPAKARQFKSNYNLVVVEWTPAGILETRGMTGPFQKKAVSIPAGAVWMVQPTSGYGIGFGGNLPGGPNGAANIGGGGLIGGANLGGGGALGVNLGGALGIGGGIPGNPPLPLPKGKMPGGVVDQPGFQGEGFKVLLSEMRKQAIPGLNVFAQAIDADNLEKVVTLPGFKTLALTSNPHIDDEHLARVGKARALSTLLLHHTPKISNKGLSDVARLPALQSLSLDGDNIRDDSLKALQSADRLHTLRLGSTCSLTAKGLAELRNLPKLERLDLCLPVTAEMLAALAECTNLTKLRLNAASLQGKELAALAKLPKLESLTLDTQYQLHPPTLLGVSADGKLRWQTAQMFGVAMGFNPAVPPAAPGKPQASLSLEALKELGSLRELVLWHPGLTDADLEQLSKLSALKRLHLHAPDLGDASLGVLEKLKNLESLDLTGTSVSPKLAKTLARLPKLKVVRVNLLANDPKAKAALNAWRTALPRVQVRPAELPPSISAFTLGAGNFGG